MNDAIAEGVDDPRARAMAHLQTIAVRAQASNVRRVSELDAALRMITAGGLTEVQRQAAIDTAHQLVGSAGTFGFERVSEAARRLEHFFTDGAVGDEVALHAATADVRQMRHDLEAGPDEDFDSD